MALLLPAPAPAAFGDRDCSFGNAGVQAVSGAYGPLMSGTTEPDGSMLLRMGFLSTGANLYRIDAGGTTSTQVGSAWSIGLLDPPIVHLDDGKFVLLTGTSFNGPPAGVARFLAAGGIDTTFGIDGYASLAGFVPRAGPVVQADGRIVVAGGYNDVAGLARFNADGTIDTSFGTGGVVTNSNALGMSYGSVALQADGKILAITQSRLSRHLPDGQLDPTFGTGGIAPISVLSAAMVAVQPSGKIILAGPQGNNPMRIARYTAAGELDTAVFGGTGFREVDTPAGRIGVVYSPYLPLAMMPDGRPVIVGGRSDTVGAIVRFGLDLEDDTTVMVNYPPTSAFATPEGRLVVGRGNGSNQVRRYLGDLDAATCISTSTAVTSDPNPSAFGQGVTLTATVTPASAAPAQGSVQFKRGSVNDGAPVALSNGIATKSVSNLAEGSTSLTAVFSGTGTYLDSTSPPYSHTVTPRIATTTTLISSPNPSNSGQAVTLTATVAPQSGSGTPVGTIQFKDGSTFMGGVIPLSSGSAELVTSTLSDGTHSLTAVYSGDATSSPSTSAPVSHVVPGRLTLNDPSVNAAAGATTLSFTVALTAASTSTVTVNYATADRTATAGTNYTATSGTLTFTPGQTSKAVVVTIAQSQPGPNKDFFLVLSSPANATLAKGAGVGTITYVDTNFSNTLAIYIDDPSIAEGASGTTLMGFNVTLSRPIGGGTVRVDFTTADSTGTAGVDYFATSGTVSFPPGVTQRWVLIPVVGNTTVQPNRTFFVNLSNTNNGTIAKAQGTGTIIDDDPTPAAATVPQYRLYSDVTKEHLYTTDTNEYSVLGTAGWVQEGVAYTMFANSGTYNGEVSIPLYRLYHPGIRQHHWTTDANEVSTLVMTFGTWQYERIPGYLLPNAVTGTTPLYRLNLANPPLHLWTTDLNEKNVLSTPQYGWVYEGVIGEVLP